MGIVWDVGLDKKLWLYLCPAICHLPHIEHNNLHWESVNNSLPDVALVTANTTQNTQVTNSNFIVAQDQINILMCTKIEPRRVSMINNGVILWKYCIFVKQVYALVTVLVNMWTQ